MSPASKVVLNFIEAINQQDWGRLREVVMPSFRRHSRAGGDIEGVESLIGFLQSEFTSFPDAKEVCTHHFADGNMVATIMKFSGTQKGPLGDFEPSGIFVSAPYIAVYRINGDRIAESWAEWDNLSTLKSLGHMK